MKNPIRIVLILITLLCTSIAIYWRIEPSRIAWHAANQLKNSKTFGFGPQGAGAQISDDEKYFFQILNSPKSHLVFRKLYDTGTQEAKAYAVVGLKQTLHGRIDSRIDDFARSSTRFFTLGGCRGQDVAPKEFVSALSSEYLRDYIHRLNRSKKEAQQAAPRNR